MERRLFVFDMDGTLIRNTTGLLVSSVSLFTCSGIVQGASFAMIPHMAKTPVNHVKSNGSITQLGNVGTTIGTPMFAVAIALYKTTGVLYLTLLLCSIGIIISIRVRIFPTYRNKPVKLL